MDILQKVIPALGLFGLLACSTLLLVRVATVYVSGRVHRIRASAELIGFMLALDLTVGPGLRFIGAESLVPPVERAVLAATAIGVAFLLNGVIRVVLWDGLLSDHGQRKVPVIVTGSVGVAIYLAAILLVMHFVYDEPIGGLLATSGVAALVLGFAAQSTLKEVFSGVALNATQALRIGDYVEIDGVYGQVHEINWRSISVKNPHTDSLYIFPNSGVADRTILNFSEPTGRFKYFVHFTLEISAPPELAIRAIAEELEHSRYVRRDPKPDFNLLGYGKEGIDIRIRYFFDGDDPWWDAQNEVIMAIWSAMRKHRLRIAINRHLLGAGDEWSDLEQKRHEYFGRDELIEQLRNSEIFSECTGENLAQLAAAASILSLNPPACFYEPGEPSDGLYLVLDGNVALFQRLDEKEVNEVKVENCPAGQLFGLQSYLNAAPRNYLAQAEQYSVVAHLPGEAVQSLVSHIPEIQEKLQDALAERAQQREKNAKVARRELMAALHADERRKLSEELRQNVDELLERPALHHFMSLLSSKVRHEDILKATMAGAGIIAACRGDVDEDEELFLRRTMAEADLLRHMDLDHGLELFREFAASEDVLARDGQVFSMLDRASKMKGAPQIAQAIAVGMTGVHGTPTQKECEALVDISKRLELEAPKWALNVEGEQDG
ncbi:mechanosensitive ion channel family protein [Marivita geojedonensis]|uniref:mechanosensitive ion channel family protein n=1 Tax=Marivita geojedonensis TaxID=1123756 RepID=UPI000A200757|nr:mechanosensitive ion channel family protein [Marivita geojedonensis]PRY78456.1 small-conductance mechanosensitive channel [Marivita geojedonensis]